MIYAIFKFPALWPYINDSPDRGDIMFAHCANACLVLLVFFCEWTCMQYNSEADNRDGLHTYCVLHNRCTSRQEETFLHTVCHGSDNNHIIPK